MNRHVFGLQQLVRRSICSSARRRVDNKVPQKQKMFQPPDRGRRERGRRRSFGRRR